MEYKFKLLQKVYFYNKYSDEIILGDIVDIRQAKYNWDYKIRYLIRPDTNVLYELWIEEQYISTNKEKLSKYSIN